MGFKNAEISAPKERKLYTGVAEMEVLGFNLPKNKVAEIYGIEEKDVKSSQYIFKNDSTGEESVRIEIFLRNEEYDILTRMNLYISNKDKVANSGNIQFINKCGQSCWSANREELISNDKLKWFDNTTARVAKDGEVNLYDFLCTLFNIDVGNSKTNIELENWNQLLKGDCTELNDLLKHFTDKYGFNKIKVLLGIKGKYQDVYSGSFARSYTTNYTWLMNNAKSDKGGGYKYFYNGSSELKEFELSVTENYFINPFESNTSEDNNPF